MRLLAVVILALLLAAAAIVVSRYQADLADARAHAEGGKTLDTPCGRIEYATTGAGRDLLMIHGAGGGFDQSLFFARRALAPGGIRIVAPSRFGYLGTPVPADASPQAQADAHACLLDALGIGRVAVLGASAGAPSAMQFCIRHAERCRALILLVPAAWSPQRVGGTEVPSGLQFIFDHVLLSDPAFWAMSKVAPGLLIRTILATPPEDYARASAADRAEVRQVLDMILPVSRRAAGLRVDSRVVPALQRFELEQIRVPTLLVSVEDDLYGTFENARYTASQIPGARFVSYPTGGHLWLGHDAEVMQQVRGIVLAGPD